MSYVYVIHMKWYPSLFLGCSNQLQVAQEQVLKANKIGGLPCHTYNTYEMVPLIVPNVFPLVAWVMHTSHSHHSSKVCYTVHSIVPAVYTYFSLDSEA